jgi:hypothetical protein
MREGCFAESSEMSEESIFLRLAVFPFLPARLPRAGDPRDRFIAPSPLQPAEKDSYSPLRSIASLQRTIGSACARRFVARLASELFLSGLQGEFLSSFLARNAVAAGWEANDADLIGAANGSRLRTGVTGGYVLRLRSERGNCR